MKKKNGFTLIELLAVIVILAVIALIAVPRIIEILNKSRLSAAEDSTMGIVEAAESYVASFMLQNHGAIPSENLEFECSSEGCLIENNLEGYDKTNLEKLNYKGKQVSSGNITISNSGKSIQATNLNINGFTCNYLNDEAYCGKKEYNSGDEYQLGDYNWHVISDDGKYLTLLMDAGQLNEHNKMNHCTDNISDDTDCGVVNVNEKYYLQYSWDKSLIRAYLNEEFLTNLESSIGTNKLVSTEICIDGSIDNAIDDSYSYGGYLKSEVDSISGAKCNNGYVTDKVRLITISEYYALSAYYKNNPFTSLWNDYGKLATNSNITRITDDNLLFSNTSWTMTSLSKKTAESNWFYGFQGTHTIYNDIILDDASSISYQVRPIITIRK